MMARIRTIKPEFWTDEKVVECSFEARLMFIGMFNFADDKGNLVRSPKRIKMQIFPADMIDCEPLIKELSCVGLLREYSVNGVDYIHIEGFSKHQKINRPSATTIPAPGVLNDDSVKESGLDGGCSLNGCPTEHTDSMSTDESLREHSVSTHIGLTDGKEGKGREKEGNKNTVSDSDRTGGDPDFDDLPAQAELEPASDDGMHPDKPDPVSEAFENIFWGAGLRKDAKVKARTAFGTKFRAWRAVSKGTPGEFASMLAQDIKSRLAVQQLGIDRMLPTSYLNGERWNDELRTEQTQTQRGAGGANRPYAYQDTESSEVFLNFDALRSDSGGRRL
ncbi:hypothetical protein F3I27_23195 [Pantoea sp. Bo_2]|nr:hypothetical protein F3I57_23350 [Pantoea sp. VH_3]KAA5944909.1 hypothetical protein F3I56_23150 [Pantoea sp. VH_25]KAA5949417.1 hypothetical protein F3I55_22810 [Pantoea sp. VH_24]KAA5955297.1 hypothetical protein F3I53_20225 [Pantoea sp. VH_16]KAA5961358.1 hypothetical protein F3I54_19800 [Pantoea sp. VH_18]KAA5976642.1 hypothetical protein F3I48_23030 [Pantoea sp. M_3]KAA5991498.1 hypothetical protein F3I46_22740 [Pantoea sp. M_1]KAA5997553.1 hypothetical protein F3I45_20805 [Pantoea s